MDLMALVARLTLDSSEYDDGLDGASKKASFLGDGLKSGFAAAGKAVVGAIGAATGAAIDFASEAVGVGMDFDSSMSNVQALTGATGKTFDDLRNHAIKMGSTTAFTITQAADTMGNLAMAGMEPRDIIDSLAGVMDLAAASGEDLASAGLIVANGLNAFGMEANESSRFANVLAVTATSAATDVGLMGETLKYVAPLAGTLNYSIEDVALATGLMANNSIVGSQAGTTLKTALSNLISPTDTMVGVMQALGLATTEYATTVDDQKIEKAQTKVANKTLDLEKAQISYNSAVEKYGAESEQAQKAYIAVEKAQNNLAQAQSDLATAQKGTTEEVVGQILAIKNEDGSMKSLRETLVLLRDKFGELDEAQQAEYAATLFGKEAMSGMLAIINASDEDFNDLVNSIDNATGAAQEMANVKLDNLAGDITYFQSAMERAKVILSDQLSPTLREFVQFGTHAINTLSEAFQEGGLSGAMDALDELLTEGLQLVTDKLPEMVEAGVDLINALVEGLAKNMPQIMEAAAEIITILADGLIEGIPQFIDSASEIIKGFMDGITESFPELTAKAVEIIETLATGLAENLPSLIESAAEMIVTIAETLTDPSNLAGLIHAALEIITALADGIIEALPTLIAAVPQIIANIVDTLIVELPSIIAAGLEIILALIDGIIAALPQLIAAVPQLVIAIVEGIIANLDKIIVGAVEIILALAKGLIGAIPQLILVIPTLIKAIVDAILGYDWGSIGKNLVEGIKNGVVNAWNSFVDYISRAFSGITDLVKGIFGEHSPSTVFAEIGSNLILGMEEGLESEESRISDFFEQLSDDVITINGTMSAEVVASISDMQKEAAELTKALKDGTIDDFNMTEEEATARIKELQENVAVTTSEMQQISKANTILMKDETITNFDELKTASAEKVSALQMEISALTEAIKNDTVGNFGMTKDEAVAKIEMLQTESARVMANVEQEFIKGTNSIKNTSSTEFGKITKESKTWGKDMMKSFAAGVKEKISEVKQGIQSAAQAIRDMLGFSEPKKGPLSNFHTYAPDMMKLFAKGIRDNEKLVTNQIEKSFDFGPRVIDLQYARRSHSGNGYGPYGDSGVMRGGDTINIYSYEKLDAVQAAREMKKAKQQMALGYVG